MNTVEQAFYRLEAEAEGVLGELMERTFAAGTPSKRTSFCFDKKRLGTLRRFLAFLRFRNSARYGELLFSLNTPIGEKTQGRIFSACLPAINEHRRRYALRAMLAFLEHPGPARISPAGHSSDAFLTAMESYCWRLSDAEMCIGIASEGPEFIISDTCFGTLSEGLSEDP